MTYHGQWPLARGDQLLGVCWPMPGVPVPTPLQVAQWRKRFDHAMAAAQVFQAEVTAVVTWPRSIRGLAFVQLPSGPLVPMEIPEKEPVPLKGRTMDVVLVDRGDFIWAERSVAGKLADEEPASLENAEEPSPEALPDESAIPRRKAAEQEPPKVIPLKRPSPVGNVPGDKEAAVSSESLPSLGIREMFPVNSQFVAEIAGLSQDKLGKWWADVRVRLSDGRQVTWGMPVRSDVERFRKEAQSKRRCFVKVTGWDERKGRIKPYLLFIRWLPDEE